MVTSKYVPTDITGAWDLETYFHNEMIWSDHNGLRWFKTRKCVLPDTLGLEKIRLFCPGDEEVIENCNTGKCPLPGKDFKLDIV